MYVYAAVTGKVSGVSTTTLHMWHYDDAKDAWDITGVTQNWSTGDPIQMPPGTAIGLTYGYRSDVADSWGIPTEQLFAGIPSASGTSGNAELNLAMLQTQNLNVTAICAPFASSPLVYATCLALSAIQVKVWSPLPDEIWSGMGKPNPNVGRVGLAFRPDDPKIVPSPYSGRFHITWQTKDGGRGIPYETYTRGYHLPLSGTAPEDTPHGLVVVGGGTFYNYKDANWPSGVTLLYAGGHVRGVGADDGLFSRYFPHVDGIFASQQRDHDDMAHIKKRLGCALVQCDSLNDD